jgi:hypothetical protein
LILRVRDAEFAKYEAELDRGDAVEAREIVVADRDTAVANLDAVQAELARWKAAFGHLVENGNGEEEEGEELEGGEGEEVEEMEGGEFQKVHIHQSEEEEEKDQSREIAEVVEEVEISEEAAAALFQQLYTEIKRLQHENNNLRSKAESQRNSSTTQTTRVSDSKSNNASARGAAPGGLQTGAGHIKHGRGGKSRPKSAANSRAEIKGETRGETGGKSRGKSGYAEMDVVTTKRPRDSDDDGDDEDEDIKPRPKRRRCVGPTPSRTTQGGKSGRKIGLSTCGSGDLGDKKRQDDTDDDGNDEDYPGPEPQRGRSFQTRKSTLGPLVPKSNQTVAKTTGRNKNPNSTKRSNFLYAIGGAVRPRPRATNNSLSGFMDDQAGTNTPAISQLGFSTAANTSANLTASTFTAPQPSFSGAATTSANLTASTSASAVPQASFTGAVTAGPTLPAPAPANNAQTGAGGRRGQGWSNIELQALIHLVTAHRNQPVGPDGRRPEILHDTRLFDLMSRQLQQQYNINRSGGACKNEWNRRGRQISGIDNRKVAKPNQMATSLQ